LEKNAESDAEQFRSHKTDGTKALSSNRYGAGTMEQTEAFKQEVKTKVVYLRNSFIHSGDLYSASTRYNY